LGASISRYCFSLTACGEVTAVCYITANSRYRVKRTTKVAGSCILAQMVRLTRPLGDLYQGKRAPSPDFLRAVRLDAILKPGAILGNTEEADPAVGRSQTVGTKTGKLFAPVTGQLR